MEKFDDLADLNRSERPNNYFCAPAGMKTASVPDEPSPSFDCSVTELASKAVDLWSSEKRVSLEALSGDGLSAHFVATTALMRFKDDVLVQFVAPNDAKSSLMIYSASRVGYSDLGTNAKRVKDWLNKLQLSLKGA